MTDSDDSLPHRRQLREFEYTGRTCTVYKNAIIPGKWSHYTAYVEIGRVESTSLRTAFDRLRVHGGLTYTDTEKIGFDTGHAFDINVDEDGDPLEGNIGMRIGTAEVIEDSMYTKWSPDAVADEVRRLAEEIDRVIAEQ